MQAVLHTTETISKIIKRKDERVVFKHVNTGKYLKARGGDRALYEFGNVVGGAIFELEEIKDVKNVKMIE